MKIHQVETACRPQIQHMMLVRASAHFHSPTLAFMARLIIIESVITCGENIIDAKVTYGTEIFYYEGFTHVEPDGKEYFSANIVI